MNVDDRERISYNGQNQRRNFYISSCNGNRDTLSGTLTGSIGETTIRAGVRSLIAIFDGAMIFPH